MADGVMIPVVVDIDQAFKDAADRVSAAIKPLQREIDGDVLSVKFKMTVPTDELKKFGTAFTKISENAEEGTTLIERSFEQMWANGAPKLEELGKALGSFKQQLNTLWNSGKTDPDLIKPLQEAIILCEDYINNRNRAVRLTEEQYYKTLQANRAEEERNFIIQQEAKTIAQMSERLSALRGKMNNMVPGTAEWEEVAKEVIKATEALARFEHQYAKVTTEPGSIKRITAEMQELERQWESMGKAAKFDKDGNLSKSAQKVIEDYRKLTQEADRFGRSLADYANEATESTSRLGSAIQKVGSAFGLYLSAHSVVRFVQNIREVTSEFELQKVALGSIIQDTEKANKLFQQIKAAAIESPFEIKDLVTYTKQLSAYRIETDKLFGVTMKLADVSAGLGVDMNRLILAYGQVRAASVLRGQELRQFTEAGIPLVELLAEKFDELGRKGTTTADVFELISKRAVSFEMVASIFDDMTSAGGMFYKMQEKQAKTLLGQWNNLKDALSIMYDEIGNTKEVHGAMTALIGDAKALIQNWRTWFGIVKTAGVALLSYVAAQKASALWTKITTAAAKAAVAAESKREIMNRRLVAAIFGKTAAENISATATKLHTFAMNKATAATKKFTASLWLMAAALANNPFGLFIIGITTALGLMTQFVGKEKNVEESMRKASESAGQLNKSRTETAELIEAYEELSSKTELSEKETRKLRDASKALAEQFPTTTKAINEQTGAFILNIDKLKEYNQKVQDALIKGNKAQIAENEKEIRRHQAFIDTIAEVREKGHGVVGWKYYWNLDKDTKAAKELNERLTDHINKKEKLIETNRELQDSIDGVNRVEEETPEPDYDPDKDKKLLQKVRAEISDLTNAYKKYQELLSFEGKEAAKADFDKLFPNLAGWEPSLKGVVDKLNGMLAKYGSNIDAKRIIENAIVDINFDDLKKRLEARLKKLSDDINRSEAARNFYKDILDATGDQQLAESITVDIYGDVGKDFKDRIQEQLDDALSTLDASEITDEMRKAFADQDFKVILKYLDKFKGEYPKLLRDLATANQKYSEDVIKNMLKALEKSKTYSEKRVKIAADAAERIRNIETMDISDEAKERLRAQSFKLEAQEIAQLEYEAFKDSPIYVQMFEDLGNASETMLANMKDRILEVRESWKELKPTQLKEMQGRLQEIDAQLAKRNPFKTLSKSIEEYNKLRMAGRTRAGDEQKAIDAQKDLDTQKQALELAIQERDAQKEIYDITLAQFKADSDAAKAAKAVLDKKEEAVAAQQRLTDAAERAAKEAAAEAEAWNQIAKLIGLSGEELKSYAGELKNLASSIKDLVSSFSTEAGEEFGGAISVIDSFAAAMGNAAKAAAAASLGDVIGAFTSGAAGLGSIISGIVELRKYIGQLHDAKWNKELDAQDKIIRRLERNYSKLSDAIEESFGNDYVYNFNEQLKILEAEYEAYLKQMEVYQEKAKKGKLKEDREAAKQQAQDAADAAEDVKKKVQDLEKSLQEFYAGTGLTAAAEAFAESWLEAYQEFGNTTDAIKEEMEDMVKSLIVKGAMAGIVQDILGPWYKKLGELAKEGTLTEQIPSMVSELTSLTNQINTALGAEAQILQAAGINLRGTVGNLSGISRDIASASEESILGLAAGINTQNSYMYSINENVKQILALMNGGTTPAVTQTATAEEGGPKLLSVQELVNSHLPNIDQNISSILTAITRVIKTEGNQHYVSVRM